MGVSATNGTKSRRILDVQISHMMFNTNTYIGIKIIRLLVYMI